MSPPSSPVAHQHHSQPLQHNGKKNHIFYMTVICFFPAEGFTLVWAKIISDYIESCPDNHTTKIKTLQCLITLRLHGVSREKVSVIYGSLDEACRCSNSRDIGGNVCVRADPNTLDVHFSGYLNNQ